MEARPLAFSVHISLIITFSGIAYVCLPAVVGSSGYLDLPYSTNKTTICSLLNGTCVSRSDCAAYDGYSEYDNTPFKFACTSSSVCCYEFTLSNGRAYGYGHGGSFHQGSLFRTLINFVDNRTELCSAVNGLCIAPQDCAISHRANRHGRFHCTLTETCCYRYRFNSGFHDKRKKPGPAGRIGDFYDYIDDNGLDDFLVNHVPALRRMRGGYRKRRRMHHLKEHVIDESHGGFGARLIRPIAFDQRSATHYQDKIQYKKIKKPIFLVNTNFTALCATAGGTCLPHDDCATTGGWHSYSSREFSCTVTEICCLPIPTDRYNFGYQRKKK